MTLPRSHPRLLDKPVFWEPRAHSYSGRLSTAKSRREQAASCHLDCTEAHLSPRGPQSSGALQSLRTPTQTADFTGRPAPRKGSNSGHRRSRGLVGPSPTCSRRRLDAGNPRREAEQHVRTQELGSAFYPLSAVDPPRSGSHPPPPPPQAACGKPTPTSGTELTSRLHQDAATPTTDRGYIWDIQVTAGKGLRPTCIWWHSRQEPGTSSFLVPGNTDVKLSGFQGKD